MNTSTRMKAAVAGAGTALLLAAGTVAAGPSAKAPIQEMPAEEGWNYCDVFDLGKLYKSDTGFINKVSLIGRYHGQYHWSDSNQGKNDDWEHRRARAGVQLGFLNNFEFEGQFNLDFDGGGRFFDSVEDLFIVWEPNDNLYAVVGKAKPKITREYSTSSKRIKTLERSQFVNQVVPDKIGGLIVGYTMDKLFLEAGLFGGVLNTEDWALPWDNSSSIAAIGRIGYDVTEETNVRLDYFYADGAGEDNAVEDYEHILSLNSQTDVDRFHLVTDLIYAKGTDDRNHSDGFSVVVMPYFDITEKLEAVARYTYSTADGDGGIRLQSRYERETASEGTRGDDYQAIYGGLNYYICEDKLKLMTGIEYSTMKQASGDRYKNWTALVGVRLYF